MDIINMLNELKGEKSRLEEAILTLERLARGQGKRRGRPPAWMKEDTAFDKKLESDAKSGKIYEKLGIRKKHRHPFTKETRKKNGCRSEETMGRCEKGETCLTRR